MRLSRKGRFAVTAMMNLALNHSKGPMTLTELTHDQGISLSYLEQIFANLRSKGLVGGVRGPGGGYCLARPASEITIADIVTAIEENAPITNPDSIATLYHSDRSPIHAMWNDFSRDLYRFMNSVTLADCVARYRTKTRRVQSETALVRPAEYAA
ncbi:MAG: Rrf2 family transcriptional regulator [Gammaproteobacteria bacterium]|nr:Rrf2 family transcriptional regulator [Gammaproteobacteria bacterium]